ncbi:MAG: threonine--tRNA ligase [Puniceicoccaceae bacterium]
MGSEMTPLEELRHSCSHILATAVLRLFPEAQLDIGPPTANGFYYDIDLDTSITAQDLERLEAEMKKVIKENQPFTRREVSREEARQIIEDFGQTRYKLGRLEDIPEGEAISFYQNGDFIDLCAGTHLRYTKQVKAFRLLNIAGAYHRGDEKNKQLQRIYGTAFPSTEELDTYLRQLEEAKLRDHRKVGKELNLFTIDEQVGGGLVLWKPRGAIIRQALQNFIGEELERQGYQQVFTPHIGRLDLFRTSGHFPYYQDSQFPALIDREILSDLGKEGCSCSELSNRVEAGEIDGYLLRPMNCPMHIRIYASEPHSYRDLPVRLAEFGTVYRWEQSGELNGMTRVRGFTQDDAHIFCTPEQLDAEISGCLQLVNKVFATLGMNQFRVRVSLRDPASDKYVGEAADWDNAEGILKTAAATLGVPYSEETGEAAFYGPKIDFVVRDAIGREWQLGTVQLDYNLPKRFELSYIGSDNKPHRPIMIHRAPFGSMERFVGVLIEHFGGNFPAWLAPEQVRILTLNDSLKAAADSHRQQLAAAGIRASVDAASDKLGAKIRRAEAAKIPFMLILGEREVAEGRVSIRSRVTDQFEESLPFESFIGRFVQYIAARSLPDKERSGAPAHG